MCVPMHMYVCFSFQQSHSTEPSDFVHHWLAQDVGQQEPVMISLGTLLGWEICLDLTFDITNIFADF